MTGAAPSAANRFRADQALLLLGSHRRLLGHDLVTPGADEAETARRLWEAPFAVLSHDGSADPVLSYGNRLALALWETDWERFTAMPSRLTAEPMHREERMRFLALTAARGFAAGYAGIRISAGGRRFRIEGATVWNLVGPGGRRVGQAATFGTWTLP